MGDLMSDELVADRGEVAVDEAVLNSANWPDQALAIGELVLRDARDEDSERIIDLIHQVWSEYPGKTLNVRHDMPELVRVASSYREFGGRFWVVERDGEIVASIAYKPSKDPSVVELQKLYVARTARRNGLGNTLCALIEDQAVRYGASAVELWSDVKLLDAHHLYEERGYVRGRQTKTYDDTSGTIRFYYRKELAARPTLYVARRQPPIGVAEALAETRAWTVRPENSPPR
jgi:putative acetyltransferase